MTKRPELDGVRGIAIILVMLYHFSPLTGFYPLIKLCAPGWAGVDVFFVLSGFLITGNLLDTKQYRNYFSVFYFRRTLRVFPLYFGCLVGFAVLHFLLSTNPTSENYRKDFISYLLYLSNWRAAAIDKGSIP